MALLSLLKSKSLAIGLGILAFMAGLLKIQSERARSWKDKAKNAESQLEFRDDVIESENEIDQEFSHRADEARKDLDEGNIPEHLRNPRK